MDKYQKELNEIFKKNNVVFAYLFGSQARNNAGPLSDIDIAVYLNEALDKSARFDKRLRIMAEVSLATKKEEVDVVVLNDAFPLIEHRILKEGKVIFSKDEKKRIDYEVRAIMRYLDYQPFIAKHTREIIYGR